MPTEAVSACVVDPSHTIHGVPQPRWLHTNMGEKITLEDDRWLRYRQTSHALDALYPPTSVLYVLVNRAE